MSEKLKDRILIWIAWKLPKGLIKQAYVRVVAHGTTGLYSDTVLPDVTVSDILNRWEN